MTVRLHRVLMTALLAGAGLLSSTLARASDEPSRGDADACQSDIHRLCDKFFPDETLVATCLVDRRADLSTPCAEVLARPADPPPATMPR